MVRLDRRRDGVHSGRSGADLPCLDGSKRTVWGNTGGGPGYHSYSLVSEDTGRQLVLAMNTYDIAAELRGESPLPAANPMPALVHVFCQSARNGAA